MSNKNISGSTSKVGGFKIKFLKCPKMYKGIDSNYNHAHRCLNLAQTALSLRDTRQLYIKIKKNIK